MKSLLEFDCYEDYLNSFVSVTDLYYLQSINEVRRFVLLGYRSSRPPLSRSKFLKKRAVQLADLMPKRALIEFDHTRFVQDPLIDALVFRERANRLKLMFTILFVHLSIQNCDISGYIDFQDSLRRYEEHEKGALNWAKVFYTGARIIPSTRDLGWYNWRSGQSVTNDTVNFKVITDPDTGLTVYFQKNRRYFRLDINMFDTNAGMVQRYDIGLESKKYVNIVIFDILAKPGK